MQDNLRRVQCVTNSKKSEENRSNIRDDRAGNQDSRYSSNSSGVVRAVELEEYDPSKESTDAWDGTECKVGVVKRLVSLGVHDEV